MFSSMIVLFLSVHVFQLDVVPVQTFRLCSAHSSRHAIGLEDVDEEVGHVLLCANRVYASSWRLKDYQILLYR